MESLDIAACARLLSLAATEAVEEPDTISRRPEVVDVLADLAKHEELPEAFARAVGGAVTDPSAYVGALSQALAPYVDAPLDDAPELIEGLAIVAWVLERAASDEGPAPDFEPFAVA